MGMHEGQAAALDGEIVDEQAVEVYRQPSPPPSALFHTDDPVEVIEKATRVADALKRVVANRGLIANIAGKEHPRVEAWQTLGSMLAVFPVKEWVRPVPWPSPVPEALKGQHARGLAFGFEASFRAQRPDGAVIGGGEAACMRTERKWASSDDFALRSMAQTRATSKALSSPLRFVMALAGYETTPAEEMPAEGFQSNQSQGRSAATAPALATAEDVTALKAAAKGLLAKQIKLAFSACGLSAPEPFTGEVFTGVPKAKAVELAKSLAEIPRPEVGK